MAIETIKWVKGAARIIDQTKLPVKLEYVYCRDARTMRDAIRQLKVRGAPAIGVAAAFGVLLGVKGFRGRSRRAFDRKVGEVCEYLAASRPTAVNLFHALERMKQVPAGHPARTVDEIKALLKKEAFKMVEEDKQVCRQMGQFGAALVKSGSRIMTVCNAGALATVDYGTAIGVLYRAKELGKSFRVYACETRPLLQGSRLTAWELVREKIDTTLICDNMAATVMKQGRVDAVLTGADRIAANGDTANKIGTYNLAVLARHHGVPFYVVAPLSTFDVKIKNGRQIPIEERKKEEVIRFAGQPTAPRQVKVYNPAFDVTDHRLITAIVTERGILRPPFEKKILKVVGGR